MACYVRIDASPEEEKRNLTASNNAIVTLEMRKDILWSLYEEHREHARHTETLRSTVISMLIVASAGLVTLRHTIRSSTHGTYQQLHCS
jgi:hypothetical protein